MIKKLISVVVAIIFLLSFTQTAGASSAKIHLFWTVGCPHCEKEKVFLESLRDIYPGLEISHYEVTENKKNLDLLKKVGQEMGINISGVPVTIVGEQYFIGYLSDETTGRDIKKAVDCALENGCTDILQKLTTQKEGNDSKEKEVAAILEGIKIPIIGNIDTKNLSLPILTFVIALVDGFNPCAMWTLLFLISLLLGMQDKKRMWILGTAFIAASAFVYFLFLTAWLNLFIFLGFIPIIRFSIGLVALGAGGYYLYDFWTNKDGGCKVTGGEKRRKFFEKLKNVTQKKNFALALGGILVLAVAVNMVELICSAGLPAIYTSILTLSNLPKWQYYLYLIFYIAVFMADDLFIFFTAMITLQATGLQSKYARYSHLIGGILMAIIGILLIFKPEWLMFG